MSIYHITLKDESGSVMVCLHLACLGALTSSDGKSSEGEVRKAWLGKIEEEVWEGVGRGQMRLWLCTALAALLPPIGSHVRSCLFLEWFQHASKSSQGLVGRHLLRTLCQNHPSRVARFFHNDSKLIRSFFQGQSKRILQWFENFARVGKSEHEHGAQALAQFAFIHRDRCWHELKWKGKHGQAPATVASKPHYFLELDVLHTVENFIENVPAFWSSQELWDSLKDGSFLFVDLEFFVEELYKSLFHYESSEAWQLVRDFMEDETFSFLCQHLLPLASEHDLLQFILGLGEMLLSSRNWKKEYHSDILGSRSSSSLLNIKWLQNILSSGVACPSLDDMMLCNACLGYARQIMHIIGEESEESGANLNKLISKENSTYALDHKAHWALKIECRKINEWKASKWLGLESFVIHISLVEECRKNTPLENLFAANKIKYESQVTSEMLRQKRKKRKDRKRTHKKKRRKYYINQSKSSSDDSGDEDKYELESCAKTWRLSTDEFKAVWNKDDIPEHLAGFAFGRWSTWVFNE